MPFFHWEFSGELHCIISGPVKNVLKDGLAGIELHYTAQLAVQPVRGFENGGDYFLAASLRSAINQMAIYLLLVSN